MLLALKQTGFEKIHESSGCSAVLSPFTPVDAFHFSFGFVGKLSGALEEVGRGKFCGPLASTGAGERKTLWKTCWSISLIQILLKSVGVFLVKVMGNLSS